MKSQLSFLNCVIDVSEFVNPNENMKSQLLFIKFGIDVSEICKFK